MNEQRLTEIEQRAAKATAGPWFPQSGAISEYVASKNGLLACKIQDFHPEDGRGTNSINDANFIAAARIDVPDLVAEVRALQYIVWRFAALEPEDGCEDDGEGFCANHGYGLPCNVSEARAALGLDNPHPPCDTAAPASEEAT